MRGFPLALPCFMFFWPIFYSVFAYNTTLSPFSRVLHYQNTDEIIANIFQILLAPSGYEELAGAIKPIRNGEIF